MKIQSELYQRALDATNSTTPFIAFRIQGKKNKDSTVKVDHYSTAFGYVLSGALKANDPLYGTSYSLKAGQVFSLTPGQNSKLVISSAHESTVAVIIVRIGYRSLDTVIADTLTATSHVSLFANPYNESVSPTVHIAHITGSNSVETDPACNLPQILLVLDGSLEDTSTGEKYSTGTAILIENEVAKFIPAARTKILSFYPVSQ